MRVIKQEEINVKKRVVGLKLRAAAKYNITPENCHVGHVVLQDMLENPNRINQIDADTDTQETNGSVAKRSCALASAMRHYGLDVGDTVVIIGPNHLDLCIPYYACHFNGYKMCTIDPGVTLADLKGLFQHMTPHFIFCPNACSDIVKAATAHMNIDIVTFEDDGDMSMKDFVKINKGTSYNFRPAVFDQSKNIAWLMLTSGTTGLPKLALIPYETLLNGICSWWSSFTNRMERLVAMGTIQWMSSLLFFISTPIMMFTRVQSSTPFSPPALVRLINKYKPNGTVWTPFMLSRFIDGAGAICDLSCFKYIVIGGSALEKPLFDQIRSRCKAEIHLVYGMTELLVPVFEYNASVPYGSSGKELSKFQYKLVNEDSTEEENIGELWLKGDEFFKGYYNNMEETRKVITEDGWIMTGDIFRKDENGYYFYVERKRLIIKYTGKFISPLQLEDIVKTHPGVKDVCVVAIPDRHVRELPIGAIIKKEGADFDAQDIFDLLKKEMPPLKQLHGGVFFMDAFPTTASGKVHRTKIRDIAATTERIMHVET